MGGVKKDTYLHVCGNKLAHKVLQNNILYKISKYFPMHLDLSSH